MSKWAYEMSDKELIDDFGKACAESGVSNSGICIDPMGPYHAERARYLGGVLLARTERLKPPFNRGDVVKIKSGRDVHPQDYWSGSSLAHDKDQTIRRIHYCGDDKWLLEFEDIPRGERGIPRFNADDFILKPPVGAIVK